MKRMLALLMAMLCLCSFAQAEESTATDGALPISEPLAAETMITASGTAKVLAPADTAVLTFKVKAKGETVSQASQQAMNSVQLIKNALAAQGVTEEQIQTECFDVKANTVYHHTRFTEDLVIEGHIAEIGLCVRLTDLSLIAKVIDAANQSGADASHELAFECETARKHYDEALSEATKQAMEKAAFLAQGAGLTLGDLVSVKELSSVEDGEASVEVTYSAK